MTLLLALLFVLVAVSGTGVALSREPRQQVLAMSANGLALALLFMALQAPDVAFAEIAVGTAAVPILFLVVLASVHMDREPNGRDPGRDDGRDRGRDDGRDRGQDDGRGGE
jgi:uncharacterized MnhB-related membrane protein